MPPSELSGFDNEHLPSAIRGKASLQPGFEGEPTDVALTADEQAVLASVRIYGSKATRPKPSANPGDVEGMILEERADDVQA